MRVTSETERRELMAEAREMMQDTVRTWATRWMGGGDRWYGLKWMDDGSAVLRVDGEETMRITFDVTVAEVPGDDA